MYFSNSTELLPAGAGEIGNVLLQVLKHDVFGNGAVGGRKVPSTSRASFPISVPQLREFALHLVEGSALHQAYQIADRQLRRHRHEQVDMVGRHHVTDDVDAPLSTDLTADGAHRQTKVTRQHL